jgi:hypothetical protein
MLYKFNTINDPVDMIDYLVGYSSPDRVTGEVFDELFDQLKLEFLRNLNGFFGYNILLGNGNYGLTYRSFYYKNGVYIAGSSVDEAKVARNRFEEDLCYLSEKPENTLVLARRELIY